MNSSKFVRRTALVYCESVDSVGEIRETLIGLGWLVINVASYDSAKNEINTLSGVDLMVANFENLTDESLKLVKAFGEESAKIPMVLIVCKPNEAKMNDAFFAGASAILTRPWEPEELRRTILSIFPAQEDNLRRRYERFFTQRRKVIYSFGNQMAVGYSMNISCGGLFILAMGSLPPVGSIIRIEIPMSINQQLSINGLATVMWIRKKIEDGKPSGIGVEFSSWKPEDVSFAVEILSAPARAGLKLKNR